MCGIAGSVDTRRATSQHDLQRTAAAMADAVTHRGPDEGGTWADAEAGVALGHRRLSIVDLSAAGRQPMVSHSGRTVLAYNGELYNTAEIRASLGDVAWRGHSDTEVLLEAIEAWGLETALQKSLGMFALAVFDRATRTLQLARDRFGKKPLYWTAQGPLLLFGSELKALRAHPQFQARLDRDSLAGFLRRGYYVGTPTVYAGVEQLMPGHVLTFAASGARTQAPYWTLAGEIASARAEPFRLDDSAATDALETLLSDAVSRRIVADVPVGAFLSGGYDSATVVALMQKASSRPVKTFTIGFDDPSYNEAPFAKAVAAHLATDHTELRLTERQTTDVIAELPSIYDEPFADASQIPTILVARLARRDVTVALTGDGGDELFAGYNRYHAAGAARRALAALPKPVRAGIAASLLAIPPSSFDRLSAALPARIRPQGLGAKLHKLATIATLDGDAAYRRLTSLWDMPATLVRGSQEPSWPDAATPHVALSDPVERMQYLDALGYLPSDILTKVDRATMSVALEARCPLLDHRVARFAWSLPMAHKIRDGRAKWLLRQVLYRHVPAALVDRPKAGFAMPLGGWLRAGLRDWAEDLLDERTLREAGIVDPQPVRALWHEHLSGRRDHQYALWPLLMFEAWRRHSGLPA